MLGDRFDGGSFVEEYTQTYGYLLAEAGRIWGVLSGKVIGEFIVRDFDVFTKTEGGIAFRRFKALRDTRLTLAQMHEYMGDRKEVYGWRISDLVMYDEPKELADFGLKRPPQSWQYV